MVETFKNSRPALVSQARAYYVLEMIRSSRIAALVAAVSLVPTAVSAQTLVSRGQSFVTASLVIGPATETGRVIGLRLTMAPGWKTYWRSPGDAGVPPEFDWSGSSNVAATEIHWPKPSMFESFGYQTLGYAGTVTLPITVTATHGAAPIDIAVDAYLGVCHDICVFEEFSLARTVTPDAPATDAAEIATALATVPGPAEAIGLDQVACSISGVGTERSLDAELSFREAPGSAPTVIVEGTADVWPHSTRTTTEGADLHVSSTLSLASESTWVDRSALRLTVLTGQGAAEIGGCFRPAG